MEKFAHDEQLEQMNVQRRRMKQLEHKRAVDALVEERRKIIQKEFEQHIAEQQKEQQLEQYRQQVIEQERQRLLHQHAVQLLGYLPKVSPSGPIIIIIIIIILINYYYFVTLSSH